MQGFSPIRQLEITAKAMRRQRLASLLESYVHNIRRLEGLQDLGHRSWAQEHELVRIKTAAMHAFSDLRRNLRDPNNALILRALVQAQVLRSRPKSRPASKASVEGLQKLAFEGQGECVVCLEKMVSGDQVTGLPCSHVFHGHCVVQWLKRGHSCPVCRFKLSTD